MKSYLPGLALLLALGCNFDAFEIELDPSVPEFGNWIVEEPDAGPEPDPWACLRDDSPRADAPAELTFLLRAVDMITRSAPEQLTAVVCARGTTCDPPLAGPFRGQGEVLSLWVDNVPGAGFDGFLRIEAPGAMPIELQFASPLRHSVSLLPDAPLEMLSDRYFASLSENAGIEVDRAKGLFWLQVFDCQGDPAEGVRFVAEPSLGARFFVDDPFAFEVDAWGTGIAGTGGLLDVWPGTQRLVVLDSITDEVIFDFDMESRPGTMAMARVYAADLAR